VPVHQQNVHWGVAVVNVPERTLQYYDSMHLDGMDILNALLRYLQDEHQEREGRPLNVAEWKLVPCCQKTTPKQNGNDCGVCTILFTDFLYLEEPLTFTGIQIAKFLVRKRLALAIMRKELIVDATPEMMEHYYGYLPLPEVRIELNENTKISCLHDDETFDGPEREQGEKGLEQLESEDDRLNEVVDVMNAKNVSYGNSEHMEEGGGRTTSDDSHLETDGAASSIGQVVCNRKSTSEKSSEAEHQPSQEHVRAEKAKVQYLPGVASTAQDMRLVRELRRLKNDGTTPLVMDKRTRSHRDVMTNQDRLKPRRGGPDDSRVHVEKRKKTSKD
jgi:Ulp1 protease family, C-terminal catalytic domain